MSGTINAIVARERNGKIQGQPDTLVSGECARVEWSLLGLSITGWVLLGLTTWAV
ncbi:MAG: hypothetical protein OXI11_12945 [Gammaproteobacteria bacterium]|nr:hypothetical protein [Gammaproteobacteria bacterium]MXW45594.1 disulfide bond formation protein B [Gammaproteobacteria bacterium]MYD02958.1 disulfide bond formation protein B [Gammaproteobacteria bacterium]MYI25581.1 disulfide bond formation protein B [Gammaproteobacteria bacterium]